MSSLTPYLPMIAALVALGLIAAVIYRKHWLSSQADDSPMKPSLSESAANHSAAAADFGHWQAEMHEYAREVKGELDAKMSALQELIAQAKAESSRLEGLIAKAERVKGDEPRG